ncbi:MAG: efflux transporter outer membrane subunit [bacterium]
MPTAEARTECCGNRCLNRCTTAGTLAVCLILLAGCAVGPSYRQPETPVPEGWKGLDLQTPAAQQSIQTAKPAELVYWWRSFEDPALASLVERAIASNLDLTQARGRVREARAARRVVAAGLWPALDASASYERRGVGPGSSGQSATIVSPGGTTTLVPRTGGREIDLFQAGLDAAWELDLFGGVRRNVEAAEADLAASFEDLRDVLVSVAAEVATNYVDLRGIQQQIAIARRNLAAQQHTAEITRKRFAVGFVGALDVANADAQAATTESQIPVLESSAWGTLYSLSVLIGLEPGALASELAAEGPIPPVPPEVPAGLPSDLLRRRPDIRRAEAQLHAATARIGVAVSDLFPKFSLTGNLGFSGDQLGSLADWANRSWGVGPSVRWPIFAGGRIVANVEVQNALEEQALAAYRKTVLTALQDVETALIAYAREQEHRSALARAVESNRKAVDLSMKLYVAGRTDFLNVLTAQRSLYLSEDALAQSTRSLATSLIALYKALGGGWEGEELSSQTEAAM